MKRSRIAQPRPSLGLVAIIATAVAAGGFLTYRYAGATLPPVISPSAASVRPVQDCGPRALLLAANAMGVTNAPLLDELTRLAGVGQDGASMAGMAKAARAMGLTETGVQMDADALANLKTPALAWFDGNHFVAVLRVSADLAGVTTALIHDPNRQDAERMTIPELLRRSGGVLLTLEKSAPPKGEP